MEHKKIDITDPTIKAIIDFETALKELTGKSSPFILFTEGMTQNEKEMEIFANLLKEGNTEETAKKKAKEYLEKYNFIIDALFA